jgi:predicted nucleic acid-binding protein
MSLAMVLGRGLLGPDGEAKRNEANLHASAPQQAWHGVLNQGWALGSDATTYLMAGAMKPLGATPQSLLAQRALRAVQFSVSAAFGAQAMQGIASALSDRSRPVPERTVEALLGAIFVVVAARGVREAARPGSARQHGLRPGGAMPSAGSHPSASGPVDPLLDTSVLSPIIEGDVQALVFAGRNVGNLSVTETGLLQALSRSSQGGTPVPELWEGVRARYRIRVMEDPSPALAQTVLRDIEMARGTKLTGAGRLADVTIIAEARREGLPLVTGDKSQFKDARAIGLTVRYRYFERSPAERLLAIHRIRKYIVEVIGDSPHTYTGSPTRMR